MIIFKKKGSNKYSLQLDEKLVDYKFKPGLRFQYYDFINHFLNKKKSLLTTSLKDLLQIYKICKLVS